MGIAALASVSMAAQPPGDPDDVLERPNVLIIMTDDQPVGTLSVMPATRNYFVTRGTRYINAFSTNPMCCPARAALMSGRYTHNNGVRTNEDAHELDQGSTLQRHLRDAGYHTAFYGKYLNRWRGDPPHFDRWALITGPYEHFDTEWNVDGEQQSVDGYWTDALAEKSVELLGELEARDPQPWLLYISAPAPHAPYAVSPAHRGSPVPGWKDDPSVPERDKSDKPRYVRQARASGRAAARVARRQMRMLRSVDDLVAKVMTMMAELDEEDTIAFFVSDNGYLWGQHGLLGPAPSKGNPYTRSVKVPMLMRWPGRVAEGHVDRRLVGFIDIAPTILAAAQVDPDPGYPQDGRSLLDAWTRARILNEFWRKRDAADDVAPHWASLRTARYSYVEYRARGRIVFREYYDLDEDPYELRNLLQDDDRSNDPDVAALHRKLATARRCTADSCP